MLGLGVSVLMGTSAGTVTVSVAVVLSGAPQALRAAAAAVVPATPNQARRESMPVRVTRRRRQQVGFNVSMGRVSRTSRTRVVLRQASSTKPGHGLRLGGWVYRRSLLGKRDDAGGRAALSRHRNLSASQQVSREIHRSTSRRWIWRYSVGRWFRPNLPGRRHRRPHPRRRSVRLRNRLGCRGSQTGRGRRHPRHRFRPDRRRHRCRRIHASSMFRTHRDRSVRERRPPVPLFFQCRHSQLAAPYAP